MYNLINDDLKTNDMTIKSVENPFKTKNEKIRLFDYFIIFGLTSKYIENLNEDDVLLDPKILYTFPKSQTMLETFEFYKQCCYKDGVKVNKLEINNENDYTTLFLESNIYSKPLETFVFIRSSEDSKYICGMKFKDAYIIKKDNNVNIFLYDKCYLFMSQKPNLNILENACIKILYEKKLNLLNKLTLFQNIFNKDKYNSFIYFNEEKYNKEINTFLTQLYHNVLNKNINILNNSLSYNIDLSETFLMRIFRKVIWNYDYKTFFNILLMLLKEEQILFIGEDLELITFSVLLFSKIIEPFEWNYTLIPALPKNEMEMLSSPIPYLVGVLCDYNIDNIDKALCNVVFIKKGKIIFINEVSKKKGVFKGIKNGLEKLFKNLGNNKIKIDEILEEELKKRIRCFIDEFKLIFKENFVDKVNFFLDLNNNNNLNIKYLKLVVGADNSINNDEKYFYQNFMDTQIVSYYYTNYKIKNN